MKIVPHTHAHTHAEHTDVQKKKQKENKAAISLAQLLMCCCFSVLSSLFLFLPLPTTLTFTQKEKVCITCYLISCQKIGYVQNPVWFLVTFINQSATLFSLCTNQLFLILISFVCLQKRASTAHKKNKTTNTSAARFVFANTQTATGISHRCAEKNKK